MDQPIDDKISSEEPEGIDDPFEAGWGDYPLDAVFVRTEPRTVGDVVDRIHRQRYILDPEFQRDFVWQVPKQSNEPPRVRRRLFGLSHAASSGCSSAA